MKKSFVILAVIVLAILSCKKDRTCSCAETKTGTSKTIGKAEINLGFPIPLADTTFSNPLNEYRTYDRVYKDTRKGAAKNNCLSYSEPFKETVITSVPASSFQLSVVVEKEGTAVYDCKLK